MANEFLENPAIQTMPATPRDWVGFVIELQKYIATPGEIDAADFSTPVFDSSAISRAVRDIEIGSLHITLAAHVAALGREIEELRRQQAIGL